MKTRSLILAAAVLAILAGALYWSNRREAAKAAAGGTPEAPRILNLVQDDITRIDIQRSGGSVSLVKLDSGDWQVAQTPPLPGDSAPISSLLSTVSALNSDRLVEQAAPGDLAPYGLSQPVLETVVTTKDGATNKILLGDNTPAGASVFAMREGDPRLFTVSSHVKSTMDKTPFDFANKKLFEFGFDFPQKVDMRIGGKSYNITFNGEEWKLGDTRMDATSMQSVIARIRDLEAIRFVAEGVGQPVIEFTVTASDGQRVERVALSRSGNEYIARREGRPALYVISDTLITDLQNYVNEMKVYVPPPAETSAAPGTPPTPADPGTPPSPAK
jgi:hypothetical protein